MQLSQEIQNASSIEGVRALIHDAQGNLKTRSGISFFGSCYVEIDGFDGYTDIDTLAYKVIEIAHKNKFEFTDEERAIGRLATRDISRLYEMEDQLLIECNCLTRIFVILRRLPFILFGGQYPHTKTRWIWKEANLEAHYEDVFSYCTINQYIQQHGERPENLYTNPFRYSRIEDSSSLPELVDLDRDIIPSEY